jgi:hypothetical protein
MWPFSKDKIEKGEYDTPINKARPVQEQKEIPFERLLEIPVIWGITLKKAGVIGVGTWPNGTPEENREYYYRIRPQQFSSKIVFNTEKEIYDYLFEKEPLLNEVGITLDERATLIKLKRVTGEIKS